MQAGLEPNLCVSSVLALCPSLLVLTVKQQIQARERHWLDEVSVHAGIKRLALVRVGRQTSQRKDLGCRAGRLRQGVRDLLFAGRLGERLFRPFAALILFASDAARRVVAVHDWHGDVHQNRAETVSCCPIITFIALTPSSLADAL